MLTFIVHSRNGQDLQIPEEPQRQQPVPPHAAIIQVRDAIHRPESDFTMPPFFLETFLCCRPHADFHLCRWMNNFIQFQNCSRIFLECLS